jgi:ABC-type glycerol-3-phosphate transport system permease component
MPITDISSVHGDRRDDHRRIAQFRLVAVISGGRPFESSTVLAYYMYDQTIKYYRIGYAAAIAVVLFAVFVAGNFVPIQILMIPVRDLSLQLGIFNAVGALVLFHIAFQTGFCALFLRNFIKQLPFELIEAARIDGASEWTVFFRIVLPLIRPALAALPSVMMFFAMQKHFVVGLTFGATKG